MGAAQSAPPVIGLSRETLLKSTQPMRDVADTALRVMLERITPRDLLSLSSPSECSKYVMVIGGAFDHFFRSIDVVPVVQGKAPQTIYFQRADVLTGRSSTGSKEVDEMQKAYRQSICKALGYFFMRFFQIFAALSLSIFDDANVQPGVYDPFRVLPTGVGYGGPRYGPVFGLEGGASFLRDAFDGLFDWNTPKKFRSVSGYEMDGYRRMRGGKFSGFKVIYFRPDEEKFSDRLNGRFSIIEDDREKMNVRVHIGSSQASNLFYIRLYSVNKQADKTFSAEGIYLEFKLDESMNSYYLVETEGTSAILSKAYYRFDNAITKIMQYLYEHERYVRENRDRRTMTRSRSRYEEEEQRRRRGDYYRGDYHREGTGVLPAELEPIYKLMRSQVRPVAHCISRSLQLINLNVLQATGGQKAYSYMCNYKFMDPHPTGTPAPGHSLVESPGMRSMEMLFAVLQNGAVQLTDQTRTEYLAFLQAMARIYEDPEHLQEGKLKALINQADAKTCARIQETQQIFKLAGPEVEIAKKAVMKLWQKQLQHTQQVDKLFAQMFAINKMRQLTINPNILKFGIPGLDHIAQSARRLLMNYYTTCEAEYQAGVKGILDSRSQVLQMMTQRFANPQPGPAAPRPPGVGPPVARPPVARPPGVGFAARTAVSTRKVPAWRRSIAPVGTKPQFLPRRGGGGGIHPDAIRLGLVAATQEARDAQQDVN